MGFLMLLLFITNKDRYALPLIYSLCLIATLEVVFIILWICYRIYLPISSVFILGVSYLLMFTFLSFAKEYNEKRKIRQMFGRYISKDVLKELEKNPHLVDLGGEEVQAAVMFSDVYDFTSLTETMSAKEMVGYLNEYFTVFGEFITDNKGLLEAYLGDGILAVFGVPVSAKQTSDYALNACTVAILQRRYARQLEIKDELSISDNLQIRTRIGIAGGVVIAGNIGSPSRMDYTVIGDAVNIASRLESINKFYKTNVIISVDIFESVKEEFICRKLDKIILKGKSTPLTIYELIDKKTDKSNNDYKWIKDYEEALRYYFEGDFQKASGLFKSLYNSPLHDEPSGIMQSRCNDLIENPPGEWEGVFTMEVK
jgi:adenylate cyclase